MSAVGTAVRGDVRSANPVYSADVQTSILARMCAADPRAAAKECLAQERRVEITPRLHYVA
jgi:hypothetical protein